MSELRTEKDLIGSMDLPAHVLYGIHTMRALQNFNISCRRVNPRLISAYGAVKMAAARMNQEIRPRVEAEYNAVIEACQEMIDGNLNEHIIVDALQGGAGTSTNMNVNEVIANRALQLLGKAPGDYAVIGPHDINLHQSTNDTYPTALHIAEVHAVRHLEKSLVRLMESFQRQEQAMAHFVKAGRTQMQDAVLTTLGRSMSCFADAVGRDRWRIYKCEERLRVVNMGGTAIGSGLGAPRRYIFGVVDKLKVITGIGLTRAENLSDATQNLDVLVEVSGMLSACAANLIKICGDLRLMASGPDAGLGELHLPAVQAGSSIMPCKVNPVIPEAVIQAGLKVQGNHSVIAQACGMGNLELNPFYPLIADVMLESTELLSNAAKVLADSCVDGITVNEEGCRRGTVSRMTTLTALVPYLGYEAVERLGRELESGVSVRDAVISRGLMDEREFDSLFTPEAVLRLGDPEVDR